jgi:VanZ family protein
MPKLSAERLIGLWLPVVLYAILIFVSSAFPFPEVPVHFWNYDKVLHLGGFGLFGILLARAIKGTRPDINLRKLYLLVAMISLLYGASDEFHQCFTPGRTVSVWDALSDGVGGFLGGLLVR